MREEFAALDGNAAVARVAYALSEVIPIYPITPSTAMAEACDAWAAAGRPNLWGTVPEVLELESETGAAGALHGAATTGALASTFTASQGLLLMIPAMYRIAGELSPVVIHASARAVATHALSIFGDHSDVMACRATGFALLSSGSVQEAMDLAAAAHAAALESRVPFLHFFDGFRTSHEIQKVSALAERELWGLVSPQALDAHRRRGLSPEHPVLRGSAQNPDVFFQSREAANPYYIACPDKLEEVLDRLDVAVGRRYALYEYSGAPDAERVVVVMGSAAQTASAAAELLRRRGEKVGVLQVRLFRPLDARRLARALPASVRELAVLDRTKEPGSAGEPLLLDVTAVVDQAFTEGWAPWPFRPRIIGGRYGLASKEFTPAMAAAVFEEMKSARPRARFTVGITDDVTHLSLDWDPSFGGEPEGAKAAVFYGLGSDGSVGAAKRSVSLIAEKTSLHAQGYFVFDSKKAGSMTVSHLRWGQEPIRAPYLIGAAGLVACHQESLWERVDVLERAQPGGLLLLNAEPAGLWDRLPALMRRGIREKGLRVFAVDASRIAKEAGLDGIVSPVMQACFVALSGLGADLREALAEATRKAFSGRRPEILAANLRALEEGPRALREVSVPPASEETPARAARPRYAGAPPFVKAVTAELIAGRGDRLPVSALPPDGTFPSGTSRWEKRAIASEVPVWRPEACVQCNLCALVCPHAAIRVKAYREAGAPAAPAGFSSLPWKGGELGGPARYALAVSPDDCTGCRLCVEACPVPESKALAMAPYRESAERQRRDFEHFLGLPDADAPPATTPRLSQLRRPLLEFCGACAGCGEAPYLKLLTQICGERLLIANATGCSSIFGGNLPASPWTTGADGRGPAWSNSLFENNAEFGLGMRASLDRQREHARTLIRGHAQQLGERLAAALLDDQDAPAALVAELRARLDGVEPAWARDLERLADGLSARSVWAVGGDGWAYDIGFGGLDHVLGSGRRVKILVLDSEVYSNTGGQASGATPRGAAAKFAVKGKTAAQKDLALHAISRGGSYAATVSLAYPAQALRALKEAEAFPGPAIVIAYSHCIEHGFEMSQGLRVQKLAVECGYWPLLRYDPRGRTLALDSAPGKAPFEKFAAAQARFKDLTPEGLRAAELEIEEKWKTLKQLAAR